MRVLVAGATGAAGRPLTKLLVERGHDVIGLTSSRPEVVSATGAKPVVATVIDPGAISAAVKEAAPDAIVDLVTRIPQTLYPTAGRLRQNTRLRTEGTRNLLAAAAGSGVQKIVSESITFAFSGRSEENMKPLTNMGGFQPSVDGAVVKEQQVREAEGIVLRFSYFYGPGTTWNEILPRALKRRIFFVLGKGTGWWSFIHVDDVAEAVLAALEHGKPGETYNICDDDPILAVDALRVVAAAAGTKPPRHIPPLAPWYANYYFNHQTGASNAKARAELGWGPKFPNFREGFARTL